MIPNEIGSLTIETEDASAAKIVFIGEPLEDVVGGATLMQARLPEDNEQVLGGAMLYIADGKAELIKTASVITGGTATALRVDKDHKFKVGEFVMVETAKIATAITGIDTATSEDYDIITITATLGSVLVTGDLLVEAVATAAATTSAAKYTANAILKETVDTTRANSNCSGIVRGSVYSGNLPYGAFADDIAALKLIRFV